MRYTVLCQNPDQVGPVWIGTTEVEDAQVASEGDQAAKDAAVLELRQRAEQELKVAEVRVLGVGKGDFTLVQWDDPV